MTLTRRTWLYAALALVPCCFGFASPTRKRKENHSVDAWVWRTDAEPLAGRFTVISIRYKTGYLLKVMPERDAHRYALNLLQWQRLDTKANRRAISNAIALARWSDGAKISVTLATT